MKVVTRGRMVSLWGRPSAKSVRPFESLLLRPRPRPRLRLRPRLSLFASAAAASRGRAGPRRPLVYPRARACVFATITSIVHVYHKHCACVSQPLQALCITNIVHYQHCACVSVRLQALCTCIHPGAGAKAPARSAAPQLVMYGPKKAIEAPAVSMSYIETAGAQCSSRHLRRRACESTSLLQPRCCGCCGCCSCSCCPVGSCCPVASAAAFL